MKTATAKIIAYSKQGWGTATKKSLRTTRKSFADGYRKLRQTPEGRAIVRDLHVNHKFN